MDGFENASGEINRNSTCCHFDNSPSTSHILEIICYDPTKPYMALNKLKNYMALNKLKIIRVNPSNPINQLNCPM